VKWFLPNVIVSLAHNICWSEIYVCACVPISCLMSLSLILQKRSCRVLLLALICLIPRMYLGPIWFSRILRVPLFDAFVVKNRMHFFTSSRYVYHLTLGGFALTFPLVKTQRRVSSAQLTDVGSDPSKINLKATIYRYFRLCLEVQLYCCLSIFFFSLLKFTYVMLHFTC